MKDKTMVKDKKATVLQFTDPVCTWCWGSEPILRRLEINYQEHLNIGFIMGGLVKDIREFQDDFLGIGGNVEKSNKNIVAHWLEASERHGMPVKAEGFNLFSDEYPSSYPQNIAIKAASLENEELSKKLLRRIREATEMEAQKTNRTEVLIQLASEVGLNVTKFIENITNGKAELLFKKDLQKVLQYRVHGFPSYLIQYDKKEILLHGFQQFEDIQSVINILSNNALQAVAPKTDDNTIFSFIQKHTRICPVELQYAFQLNATEYATIIDRLKNQIKITEMRQGNGSVITAVTSASTTKTDTITPALDTQSTTTVKTELTATGCRTDTHGCF